MRLDDKDLPLIKKFAIESCLMDNIKDPSEHVTNWTALCIILNKKKLTLKNLTEFAKEINKTIAMQVGKPARELKELLEWLEVPDSMTSFEAHNQYVFINPYSDSSNRIARAIWLWKAWKHEKYRYEKPFSSVYYEQALATALKTKELESMRDVEKEMKDESTEYDDLLDIADEPI